MRGRSACVSVGERGSRMCQGVHGDECGGNIRFVNIRSANVNDRYFTGHGSLGYNCRITEYLSKSEIRSGMKKEEVGYGGKRRNY